MQSKVCMPSRFVTLVLLIGLLFPAWQSTPVAAATCPAGNALFVDADASGNNDGSSWVDAFTDLQAALASAESGQCSEVSEIWLAAGRYYPVTPVDLSNVPFADREISFQLVTGIALYGGFAGGETSRDQRDWEANPTILSGDIDRNDTNNDGNAIAETWNDIQGSNSIQLVIGADNATLDGLTITAGNADRWDRGEGGGIYNLDTDLSIRNVVFSGNYARDSGGAIYNKNSSSVLRNVHFRGNYARDSGGGIINFSSDNLVMTDVTFSGNEADSSGGAMYNNSSDLSLTNVRFIDNRSSASGGAMSNFAASPTLTDVTFTGNQATSDGGAMDNWFKSSPVLSNVTFTNNQATDDDGGAVYNNYSNPTFTNVTFAGNQAASSGGAMYNTLGSTPVLTNVDFLGNEAASLAGGMYNNDGTPTLTNVVFAGNRSAGHGGAMRNKDSAPVLTNVTFAGNQAAMNGGAIYNSDSTLLLQNSIIWGNVATGEGNQVFESNSTLTYSHSLVEGSALSSGDNNLDGTDSANDPRFIAPVAAGEAPTTDGDYRLKPGSPAIARGNNAADIDGSGAGTTTISDIANDLNGEPRIFETTVDLGAYEFQGDLPIPAAPVVSATTPTTSTLPTWNWTGSDEGSGTFRYKLHDSDLSSGATATTATSFTPESPLEPGSHTLYVQEANPFGDWSESGSFTIVIEAADPPAEPNFPDGAPGSIFVITVPNLPAGPGAAISIRGPGETGFTELGTLTVPEDGTLVFLLLTDAGDPTGTFTIRIVVETGATSLAETITREVTITLDNDAPLRNDRPAGDLPELNISPSDDPGDDPGGDDPGGDDPGGDDPGGEEPGGDDPSGDDPGDDPGGDDPGDDPGGEETPITIYLPIIFR
jgi:predicted outer membrane repeat protein